MHSRGCACAWRGIPATVQSSLGGGSALGLYLSRRAAAAAAAAAVQSRGKYIRGRDVTIFLRKLFLGWGRTDWVSNAGCWVSG